MRTEDGSGLNADEVKDVVNNGKLAFGRLSVAAVDLAKQRVFIGCNDPDFQLRIELLKTEDARRLALRQANLQGWRDCTLSDYTIIFDGGRRYSAELDDETPYLLVEIYTPSRYEFESFGDSLG